MASGLSACASLAPQDPLRVEVMGIELLSGRGLEFRMAVKLRLLNPINTPIAYGGAFMELDVRNKHLASGVSSERGGVPRFGETVLTVAALRQDMSITAGDRSPVGHVVRGKLSGPLFNIHYFTSLGEFKRPTALLGNAP